MLNSFAPKIHRNFPFIVFLLIFHKLVLLVKYFHHTSHFNGALTSREILRYKSSPNNSFRNDLPFPQGLYLASATSSVLFLVNPSPKISSTPSFKISLCLVFSSTAPRCKCRAPLAPPAGQQELVRARLLCQPAWQDRLPSLLLACCCSDSTACRRSELGSLGNDRKQGLPALTHCPIWVFERFDQSQKISV